MANTNRKIQDKKFMASPGRGNLQAEIIPVTYYQIFRPLHSACFLALTSKKFGLCISFP